MALALVPVALVFAIADPDSPPSIAEVKAFANVLEADDFLVVVEYDLEYASLPTEPINDAYLGRFFIGDVEQNSTEPFAFNDRGYGRGLFSLYWTAAQKETSSIEFSNPNGEDYRVTFQGKVGVFPGAVPTTTTTSILYADSTDTLALLHTHVKDVARSFEFDVDWAANSQDLITSVGGVDLLTAAGEEYFANAIPHLASMVPTLFSSGVTGADFTEETFGESYSDDLDSFWEGHWVDTRFNNLAASFDAPKSMFKAGFALFWIVIIMWFVAKLLDNTDVGRQFGVLTVCVTLPMFAAVNFLELEMVVLVAFLATLALGWTLMLRRAGG